MKRIFTIWILCSFKVLAIVGGNGIIAVVLATCVGNWLVDIWD